MKGLFITYLASAAVKRSFTAALAGMFLGIGFVFPNVYALSFLGAGIFIYINTKSTLRKSVFWLSWLSGVVFYLLVFANVAVGVIPIDWIGIDNVFFQCLTVISAWVTVSTLMGLGYSALGLLINRFKTDSWHDFVLIPFLWVICEVLTSWIFSLVTLGPGTLLGGHFTLGFVGYLMANNSFILQLAWLGGVFVLSFGLVFVATVLLKWWEMPRGKVKKRVGTVLLIMFYFLLILGPVYMESSVPSLKADSEDTIKVAVISRYVPPSLDKDDEYWYRRYLELVELVEPLRNVDLLVFPENSAFLQGRIYEGHNSITSLSNTSNGELLVIDSRDIRTEDGSLRAVATFSFADRTLAGEKQFLLPFGEYQPYIYEWSMRALGQGELVDKVQNLRGYKPGTNEINPKISGAAVGMRFCDEVLSPWLYRGQVNEGANILVNISSLSWFHGSASVYEQVKNVAKVRAVESGRWYVQSGNMAPAFVLDDKGRVVTESERGSLSVLEVMVPSLNEKTGYTLIGG